VNGVFFDVKDCASALTETASPFWSVNLKSLSTSNVLSEDVSLSRHHPAFALRGVKPAADAVLRNHLLATSVMAIFRLSKIQDSHFIRARTRRL
jgi:hypothetical protein